MFLFWNWEKVYSKMNVKSIFRCRKTISPKNCYWNSSDCFESFSPLNNVWIDRPLMPSSDVTHYPKTGQRCWLVDCLNIPIIMREREGEPLCGFGGQWFCLREVFRDQLYNSTFLLFLPSSVMILLAFLSCLLVFFFFVKDQIASFQLKQIIVFLN